MYVAQFLFVVSFFLFHKSGECGWHWLLEEQAWSNQAEAELRPAHKVPNLGSCIGASGHWELARGYVSYLCIRVNYVAQPCGVRVVQVLLLLGKSPGMCHLSGERVTSWWWCVYCYYMSQWCKRLWPSQISVVCCWVRAELVFSPTGDDGNQPLGEEKCHTEDSLKDLQLPALNTLELPKRDENVMPARVALLS